jgi:hypothetical protein
MVIRRAGVTIAIMVTAAASYGCSRIDARTESARKRILGLDATESAQIVAFCKSWRQQGALQVDQFPSALPVRPTSASADGNVVTFSWWNNSHAEEDEAHPGFELICSESAVKDANPIAPGLWYRDAPMR